MRLRSREAVIGGVVVLAPVAAAWLQAAFFGVPAVIHRDPHPAALPPNGFPAWLRITHYVNFLMLVLLARSGLQILFDHPRLYWDVGSTPGREWCKFTSAAVPMDRPYTAIEDARPLSAWIGLPGGWHTVGIARHWHYLSALFWLVNGVVFVALLFLTDQWRRLVPTSWSIVPEAWTVFVHYATFRMPPEPDPFYAYNALQQLAYFGVVFLLSPLALLTGAVMSPAITAAAPWYPRLFGNRQIARSVHFLVLVGFAAFLVPHVLLVALTGLRRNMNLIVTGKDTTEAFGLVVGVIALAAIAAVCVLAQWVSHHRPRQLQLTTIAILRPIFRLFLNRLTPRADYPLSAVSPYFWHNGKIPTSDEWTRLAAGGFRDYRLEIGGLVDQPMSVSLQDLQTWPRSRFTTLTHCIQGWSGIATWEGVAFTEVIRRVRPRPEARFVLFVSFGEGIEGGPYYDTHTMEDLTLPQSLLADTMNGVTLPLHHGAPLRLRVENQLGFKMIKWIRSIEFVATLQEVGQGQGGYNEDHEFYNRNAKV